MPPPTSEWNPTGSDTNCMACVARYLHSRLRGAPLDEATSRGLELLSAPDVVEGHAAALAWQKRNAVIRTATIMKGVGLAETGRYDASVGMTRFPAGHYAVVGLARGHVIYGRADADNQGFAELYCPQWSRPVTLASLNGSALAIRYE